MNKEELDAYAADRLQWIIKGEEASYIDISEETLSLLNMKGVHGGHGVLGNRGISIIEYYDARWGTLVTDGKIVHTNIKGQVYKLVVRNLSIDLPLESNSKGIHGVILNHISAVEGIMDAVCSYVIPWTGGIDSTAVLFTVMKRVHPSHITIVHIESDRLPENQVPREVIARKRLTKWFAKQGMILPKQKTITLTDDEGAICGQLPQPLMWLGILAACRCSFSPKLPQEVVMGYCCDDYGYSTIHHIIQAYKHLSAINNSHWQSSPSLVLPFIEHRKYQVIQDAQQIGFYDLCWWCERPDKSTKPCGTCGSCRTHDTALARLAAMDIKE